jgi:hypothetical protein
MLFQQRCRHESLSMHLGYRCQQHRRTSSLARPIRGVACEYGSRGGCTKSSAPCAASGGIACHNDGSATSLTDAIADWTSGGDGDEKNHGGSGDGRDDSKLHLEVVYIYLSVRKNLLRWRELTFCGEYVWF